MSDYPQLSQIFGFQYEGLSKYLIAANNLVEHFMSDWVKICSLDEDGMDFSHISKKYKRIWSA